MSLKTCILFISEKNEMVQHFEVTLQRSYLERLFALATKLYRTFRTVRPVSHFCVTKLTLELLLSLVVL